MPAIGTLLSWELGLVKSLLHINSLVAHASPKLRFSAERLKRLKRAWKHQILPTLPITTTTNVPQMCHNICLGCVSSRELKSVLGEGVCHPCRLCPQPLLPQPWLLPLGLVSFPQEQRVLPGLVSGSQHTRCLPPFQQPTRMECWKGEQRVRGAACQSFGLG